VKYTVKEVKEEIKKGMKAYMQKNEDGTYYLRSVNRIPFYLEGRPGIGKTEIVRQVADELGIGFVSFSITHHTRNSLLGLPVISNLECGKYTEYTMSEIIAAVIEKEEEGQKEGILLLDEFNCASETIMPTMLAFLQTRNIGKYKIPEGWSVVLCGNPSAYNKSARQFDAAIIDRVRKMEVEYDITDFLSYASEKNFHESVIKYLEINRKNIYRCIMQKDGEEVVTCRGWENLSHMIKMYEQLGLEINEQLVHQYIKSVEIAHSFYAFYLMFAGRISAKELEEILDNKNVEKHVQVANGENFQFRWKMVEQLGVILTEEEDKLIKEDVKIGKREKVKCSKKISNAIQFIEKLDDASSLMEQFMKLVNESRFLVSVLGEIRNEEYLKLCRKAYGELDIMDDLYLSITV